MTISVPKPERFEPNWPEPSPRYIGRELPNAPTLPLEETFGVVWAEWIKGAAEAKSAPTDYVVAALLAVCGSLIGNARWVAPWHGWAEPPILWTVIVGLPSSNKSPAFDAILASLKAVENELRSSAKLELAQWQEKEDLAKLAKAAWKEEAKVALKEQREAPEMPSEANPGSEPHLPRLFLSDSTIEQLVNIVSKQPRGTLMVRDELAGWLQGMTRYSSGNDRPIWLEAYGGRPYGVERVGREPVDVERFTVGVTGGIQPDRLKSLLMKTEDDGLLARFLPFWPGPCELKRPNRVPDDVFLERALKRLLSLQLMTNEQGHMRPWFIPFSEEARCKLDKLRQHVRVLEGEAEGVLLSFIGKMPGFSVRLALIIAHLDWVTGQDLDPHEISEDHFERAAGFIEVYMLGMARRTYADASLTSTDRGALRVVALIREKGWERFTSREIIRMQRSGLETASRLNPILATLEEGDVIKGIEEPKSSKGGRPARLYAVNPAVFESR